MLNPDSSLTIHSAIDADVPSIHAIYSHHVIHGTASWEYEPPSLEEMHRRFKSIIEAGYPYIVARLGQAVVGYACAGSYRPRPGYRFTAEDSIYVHPDRQGKGIGTALLEALIARLRETEIRNIIAVIGDSENHASIRLHAAHGFVQCGVLPKIGFKHDCWLDAVLMIRQL